MVKVWNRQRKIALDRAALEEFARRGLSLCAKEKGAGLTSLSHIDVLLISDRRMSELHQRFMGVAGPTDIITFQHGEIFISVETARRQARAQRTSLGDELRLYLVHGFLHLSGFDDHEPGDRRRMRRAEAKILRQLAGK